MIFFGKLKLKLLGKKNIDKNLEFVLLLCVFKGIFGEFWLNEIVFLIYDYV